MPTPPSCARSQRLYTIGLKPEWWKLAPMQPAGWQALAALVQARDPGCRGAVILGLNQPLADLARGFAAATHPIVKGFMVGRPLGWHRPAPGCAARSATMPSSPRSPPTSRRLVDAWRTSRPASSGAVPSAPAAFVHSV